MDNGLTKMTPSECRVLPAKSSPSEPLKPETSSQGANGFGADELLRRARVHIRGMAAARACTDDARLQSQGVRNLEDARLSEDAMYGCLSTALEDAIVAIKELRDVMDMLE
jgi:hypothetical protein